MSDSLLEYKLDLIAEAMGVYRIETVTAVMRRQHTNDDGEVVDVVDFFPEWNQWGTYGKMKVAHEYLDQDWQRERFEKFAGVSVDALPLYDGQAALMRRFGVPHKCEVAVRPFRLMVQPRKDADGNHDKTLILRYLIAPQTRANPQQPVRAQTPAPATAVAAPAPIVRPQAAPTAKIKTATEWEAEARAATDELIFDAALVKCAPWFQDSGKVCSFRELLFGEFDPEHTAAYVAGLLAYKTQREKANGSREAHNQAKARALVAYRDVLEGK